MVINTKFSVGDRVMFEYGTKKTPTFGNVARIEIAVHSSGRTTIKYWVVYDGCCSFTIPEKRLVKA